MRKRQVWRYYCEYCKKAGCSGGHMARHEAGCTANPNRVCGVCRIAGLTAAPLAQLIAFCRSKATWDVAQPEDGPLHGSVDKAALDELRSLAGGCPVCMFAALRQSNVYASKDHFDMKAELAAIWSEVNAERERREYAYG